MKTTIKIVLCLTSLFIVSTLKAQIPEYKSITIDDSAVSAHIQDNEMSVILDRVFPNVEYEFHYSRHITPCARNFTLKYQNEIYTLDGINRLLFAIKYSQNSIRDISDEDLIKAFVYLSIFSSVPDPYQKHEFNIEVTHINKEYSGELLDDYKRIGFNDIHLNFHCTATWKDTKQSEVISEWEVDFNIIDGEFISMVGSKKYSGIENKRSNKLWAFEYSAEMEKLRPTGRDYMIQYYLKKN